MAAVDGYLASGDIDVLDLSTGLREPDEYASWGLDRRQAQVEAWAEAKRRGWADDVRLQARKALAHPGYTGDAATARDDVVTFVDLPVEAGAGAVDVWTWRQTYDGQAVRLLDRAATERPVGRLRAARDRGAFLRLTTRPAPSRWDRPRTSTASPRCSAACSWPQEPGEPSAQRPEAHRYRSKRTLTVWAMTRTSRASVRSHR